ncbi:MAG: Crp/Fnr family transcriptional regulator [Pedobacter sp.]
MNEILATYLQQNSQLTSREIEQISDLAIAKKVKKGELLLQEGDICRHKIFVARGLLRTFGTTPDGVEHILYFSPELNWTVDVESYNEQTPSHYYIDAVEQSDLLLWSKTDFDQLIAEIPAFNLFREQLIAQNTYSSRHRILTTLSATPEQKYEDFIHHTPQLLARLPLRMIASYLGISLKTLTRIRHAQLQQR